MPVYTIPAEIPFLDALAAGLEAPKDDPLALARQTILLPTRRAVRALGEAFLRASEGRALLLPRLMPVGDLDAEELSLIGDAGEAGLDILPAVPELRRRLLLARLVLRWGEHREGGPRSAGQAAPLAAGLARFLDEVQAEGCDLAALDKLVPAEHAAHWQEVLTFLDILRQRWPEALADIGCLDPAVRRNRVLAAQASLWRREPPKHPVIAAGITGGIPAVAELVATVAQMPGGMVVLPGLARDCDPETWRHVEDDPSHPQYLMARLLDRLGLDPADVKPWPAAQRKTTAARRQLVEEALRPAGTSERWREVEPIAKPTLENLSRFDCPGPQEEAVVIALVLREQLERPGETAALVTPDRALARRVAAELRRWGIEIDDSAGLPLNLTAPGVFLRLLLEAAQELAPVPLLALLKHPLAALGLAPERCRTLTRLLEVEVLRGPRPAPGVAGLESALAQDAPAELGEFIAQIGAALTPLCRALGERNTPLKSLVAAHLAAAEAVARSAGEAGAARLWRDSAGEAAAAVASDLLLAAEDFPALPGGEYPALFEGLLVGLMVRPRFGRHPRLFIWGLLEARLQQADLLVLGGLNEGVWPAEVESDPWLSRPMRKTFGLPPPEQRIGIAAHDFAQGLGAPRVVMTRATRVEGTPTVPSRWLLRLDTVLRAGQRADALQGATEPLAWQALLDKAARVPVHAPEPRPPVASRPRRLSVTEIETWMRDPYAIYARHVLRLRALDPLDADPGAADRGNFIHAALDAFVREFPAQLPADAAARLTEIGQRVFGNALERPGVYAFWWPRFRRVADWFVDFEAARRTLLAAVASECRGQMIFPGPAGPFTLIAKADRVDCRRDGHLSIIDYKTGGVPKGEDVRLGFSPQLPLEAAIAEAGGFNGVAAAEVAQLAFLQLSGGDPPGRLVAADAGDLPARVADAIAGLERLIAHFDDPATPYRAVPRPDKAPTYGDYKHLARIKEWSVAPEAEE